MKTLNSVKNLEVQGQETSGAVYFLLGRAGCAWDESPSTEQAEKMLKILNAEFEADEGEVLYWGAEGKVFEVNNGVWVAA